MQYNILPQEKDIPTDNEPMELSQQEVMAFEEENNDLMNEFNSVLKEVKEVEKKVLEISQLQLIMENHVLHQAKQIEDLQDEAQT